MTKTSVNNKCCSGCDCHCEVGEPRAIYYKGTFTGFVTKTGDVRDGTLVRLHDVGGPLDGPSHVATRTEHEGSIIAHGKHPTGSPLYIEWMPGVVGSCCADGFAKEVARLDPNEPYVVGPFDFTQRRVGARMPYFDAIRAGDRVRVCVEGQFMHEGALKWARERFPCDVLAIVPTTGVLVVKPAIEKLFWIELDTNKPYRLQHTAVIALFKGDCW